MTREKPNMRVLATICARGGSKGVPGKNLRHLLGKPLIAYTIECARACPFIERIVVSTDSPEIASIAEAWGVEVPFLRPAELATDSAAKIHAIRHATQYVEEKEDYYPEFIVDLDTGSPLRSPEDVGAVIDVLVTHPHLDAAVAVYDAERNPYYNMVEFEGEQVHLVKQINQPLVRRQDAPDVYSVSGSVFAFRRSSLMLVTHLYSGAWGAAIVPPERAVDIDREIDLKFAEFLISQRGAN